MITLKTENLKEKEKYGTEEAKNFINYY